MAVSPASAVSSTPPVDNSAKASASAAGSGGGKGATFTDSLDAILAPPSAAGTKTSGTNDNEGAVTPQDKDALAKLKSKLKNGNANLTPQQLALQQAIFAKLEAANAGLNIAALRAALKNAQTVQGTPVPGATAQSIAAASVANSFAAASSVANGSVPGQAIAPPGNADGTPDAAATIAAATKNGGPNGSAPKGATSAAQPASAADIPSAPSAQTDPSKDATHAATQSRLVAALIKIATAPVLKSGEQDGSKVPNTKAGQPGDSHKASKSADHNGTPSTDTVQAMAAKIAATAGATHPADTAPTAAKGVAVAVVASRTASAAPTVTKIESAAMANATQTATHNPAPQANVEAQALPVQFDAKPADKTGKDADTKKDDGDKSQTQTGTGGIASNASKAAASSPAPDPSGTQSSTPAASTTTASNSAASNATTAANAVPSQSAAPVMPQQVATTLHVSQQPQPGVPMDGTPFAALGIAIAAKFKNGDKQFDINLHPADLGRVDVRISVDASGKAQAHLAAQNPQTLQLLQNDKAALERGLREAGLNLANNGLNFSLRGEQQSSTPTFTARSRALSISAIQTADISSSSSVSIAPGDSRLDIRV